MSVLLGWKRRLARHLVGHAERVLSPVRPGWMGVLRSELEHVPEDSRALRWAVGCVWASYRERYLTKGRSLAAAVAVGIVFALLDATAAGRLATRPMPHWYGIFARAHKHVGLELWLTVMGLPIALIATACGALLGIAARRTSTWLPFLSLGVWQFYLLADDFHFATAPCPFSFRTLWEGFVLFPASSMLGIAMPACALVLGFRLTQGRMAGLPNTVP